MTIETISFRNIVSVLAHASPTNPRPDQQRGSLKTKRDDSLSTERLPKPNWIRVKAASSSSRFSDIKDIVRTNQLVTVRRAAHRSRRASPQALTPLDSRIVEGNRVWKGRAGPCYALACRFFVAKAIKKPAVGPKRWRACGPFSLRRGSLRLHLHVGTPPQRTLISSKAKKIPKLDIALTNVFGQPEGFKSGFAGREHGSRTLTVKSREKRATGSKRTVYMGPAAHTPPPKDTSRNWGSRTKPPPSRTY